MNEDDCHPVLSNSPGKPVKKSKFINVGKTLIGDANSSSKKKKLPLPDGGEGDGNPWM